MSAQRATFEHPGFDYAPTRGEYVGTLRWDRSVSFPGLPPFPEETPVLHSWPVYLLQRLGEQQKGAEEGPLRPQQMDALSFPLTLAACIRKLAKGLPQTVGRWLEGKGTDVDVVIIGASHKTEQRVLEDSSYWEELAFLLPQVNWRLHFVGPEVSGTMPTRHAVSLYCAHCKAYPKNQEELLRCSACKRACFCSAQCQKTAWPSHKAECRRKAEDTTTPGPALSLLPNLSATVCQGTVLDFLRKGAEKKIDPARSIFVGFNTGMASGNEELMESWVPDTRHLLERGYLWLNTCANTWGDLKGELTLLSVAYGAAFKLLPASNPFRSVSVMLAEEPDAQTGVKPWHCANFCCYAVQGYDTRESVDRSARSLSVDDLKTTVRQLVPAFSRHAPLCDIDAEEKGQRKAREEIAKK
eukprot:Hpha_TRINITY_DN15702_c2_g3::TRINITY_DN15702_c2_g3_i1::g.37892::m.37892